MKRKRSGRFFTKMMGRKVRLLSIKAGDPDAGRAGVVINVYLGEEGTPMYTVMLKDGRLVERKGETIVVEA